MDKRIYATARFKERYDTTTNWQELNPILMKGERAIEELEDGSLKEKIGNGVDVWNDLPYFTVEGSGSNIIVDQTYNPESENVQSGKAVAEALATINVGGGGSAEGYEIIGDITLTEATSDIVFRDNINKYNDFLLLFVGTVSQSGPLRFATGFNYGTGSFIIPSFLYVQSADATTQYTWYNKVDYIKSIENSDGTTNRIYLTSCCLGDTMSTLRGWHTKQVKSLPTSFFVHAMNGKPYAVGSRFILLGKGAI